MAANMPQMGGGGPVRPRPPHQQLSQMVYTQMMAQASQTNGWQDQVSVNLRVSNAMNLISNSFLAMPTVQSDQLITHGLSFEREAYLNSGDKSVYDQKISSRVQELFKRRQAHEQSLQNSLNNHTAQIQAQAQAQMIMNRNMMPGAMGQPPQHGFQHLQQQMQPSPIPQQSHQPGMGMAGPGGLSMNPNQQTMQMNGGQMRPQMPMNANMAGLSPQDRAKVTQLAVTRLNQTPEQQKNTIRMMLQQKMSPQQMAQMQQDNIDPLLFFFQNQIVQSMKGHAGANMGNNHAAMQMQAQQRQMNQSGQQMNGVPNGDFPFENIMNQQKAGILAQEAGQMVVPASSGPGRNATPQPMGGVQIHNPGNNPGINQAGIPNQLQPQFTLPQAQQLKMDQRAAQSQAQIRAQAQAKQIQGQPGGINVPGHMSQSPGMNTLNTPVRRTPVGMGQGEGQPQMGQPNGPFAQGMDPRFNQGNQRLQNSNLDPRVLAMLGRLPPEQRGQFFALPPDKRGEMIKQWTSQTPAGATGQIPGRGQPPTNQFGPQGNSMAPFGPGNNAGQQPNPNAPMNPQNQMHLQQLNRMRMQNMGRQMPADMNAFMDSMDVAPRILEQLRLSQGVPPELKKWGQVKQLLAQRNPANPILAQLQAFQTAQFQNFLKQRAAAGGNQGPQPNMPPQGPQPTHQQMPTQPAANMGPFQGITVTAQEMQNLKNHDKFKHLPDDKIRQAVMQMKMNQHLRARAAGQAPNAQMQTLQTSQSANPSLNTSAPPPNMPNVQQQQPRQQNMAPDANAAGSTAPLRNNKQAPNNRQPQTTAPAAPQKNNLKRASTDDVVEVPNPSSTPVQRPPSQQAQAPGSVTHLPQLSQQQIASLTSEQRNKYLEAVKKAGGPPMSEEMQRLKTIGQEEHTNTANLNYNEIPMAPEVYQEMAQKIRSMVSEVQKISRILGRWYTLTKDESRARMFFKMRLRLVKQFADGERMTTLKKAFSLQPKDLEALRGMLESMAKDVATQYPQHSLKRNITQQQNGAESGTQQTTGENTTAPPVGRPAPLNAVNLEKQTQALNKMHQRTGSKSGQPPAAPTTSQPPFQFGAQSPDGRPTYGGEPAITQTNLQLPARKKARTGAQPGAGSGGPSANSSPQVQKAASPEMVKRPASEIKLTKLQFHCPEANCDAHTIGFSTEEAMRNHIEEEHTKPRQNPLQYVTESLAVALGLEPDGNSKPAPVAPAAAPGPSHTPAPPMTRDISKQGQTPMSRVEGTPMSREASSMKRQSSSVGAKPTDLSKVAAGKASTPKPDSTIKGTDGALGAGRPADERPQAVGADAAWATMTIDPQDLFQNLGGLEGGGNGAISDMSVYRAISPNNTPESSKDSASSEPNSDVSEGVSLNLKVDMGFDVWHPFGGGQFFDPESAALDLPDTDLNGTGAGAFAPFSWDDIDNDFNGKFELDTSLYSLDTT
ncbi:uncharacterized protein F4822DRAFT_4654 [Hypoxylon trugodes]|uniref:uncharacterized protein n=1 Tax=Hypoxylon trugodes TaxID=326681 RepID=UPI002192E0FB|nr:uncharacterized protein F4822DRAFT_4654 [Hypoxylon trugodes]KAI1393224.1 hypothetical protein F4822DRAFT_4654 [Hypoxylon trugodes]